MYDESKQYGWKDVLLSIFNIYAPIKKKDLRANHASFVLKLFQKEVMTRTRLRNTY